MTAENVVDPITESDVSNGFSILVVEDVRMIYDVIERTLRDLEIDYSFAQDGVAALAELEIAVPDLIILDLALPLLDGWEVLRSVRADPRTEHVPVLVITAHGQSGLEAQLESLGSNGYLDKPFQPKALRRLAYELLGVK